MPENAENAVVPVAEKRPRSSGRVRNGLAKRATGIPREPPWSKCNRTEKERGKDEDGEWTRDVYISRACALLKAGVSASARAAASGAAASGGSATVLASLEQSARDIAEGGDVGPSTAAEYDKKARQYESWCLYALPDNHPEHERVQAMEDALVKIEDPDVVFNVNTLDLKPADPNAVLTFLDVMNDVKERTCESSRFQGEVYKGRNTGFTIASQTVTALQRYDRHVAGHSKMDCLAVKNKLKKIASGYEPESVASFDVATGLPLLKKALYEATWEDYPNPFNTGIQRDMVWTMLHLSLAIGARASLLTDFCPMIDQLDFPGKDERCTDGKPMFFKLKLYRWKHNPGRRQQELIVRRNFANPEFCPVLTMLHWLDTLKANGIENGPLFPALNKAHDDFLREEIDGVMHLQRMTAQTFGKWTRDAFVYAGGELAECTHHSIRRAFVKWGARCGGKENDIKVAGRWKTTSERFRQYWGEGQTTLASTLTMRSVNPNYVDPIYAVWVWEPLAQEATSTNQR